MATKALPTPPPLPRYNSHARPRDKVKGSLPAAATVSNPEGTQYVPIGVSTPAWAGSRRSRKGSDRHGAPRTAVRRLPIRQYAAGSASDALPVSDQPIVRMGPDERERQQSAPKQ
jgi:hypothetical protein